MFQLLLCRIFFICSERVSVVEFSQHVGSSCVCVMQCQLSALRGIPPPPSPYQLCTSCITHRGLSAKGISSLCQLSDQSLIGHSPQGCPCTSGRREAGGGGTRIRTYVRTHADRRVVSKASGSAHTLRLTNKLRGAGCSS